MKIKKIIFQIKNLSFDQALEYCIENAQKKRKKTFVVTINPELIMLAQGDSEYEKILSSADLAVCDGIGIVLAGKFFGKEFKERIHGVDLFEKLSEAASNQPITIGLLGGDKNVAQRTGECLKKKYPGLKIAFAESEWSEIRTKKTCDILFVAFGSPKQEKWIYKNLPKIEVKLAVGVGGSFDFISGKVRRAPLWIRKIGLEWLFRLIIQPWRIKRQLALPKFVMLVIGERIRG